jgi:biotin carboxyl carrier protein
MPGRGETRNPDASDRDEALIVNRDHDAIARLADDLLPALMAKLAATGLGEIEVRQGGWKARLRMPAAPAEGRRVVRAAEGHAGHTHATGRPVAPHIRPEDVDLAIELEEVEAQEPDRAVAASPAVGIYHPSRELTVGMRVRAGDRIGSVDVLGVKQDVVSPVDGVIGSSLAEAGEAVEYGQELVRIELPERIAGAAPTLPGRETAGVAGKA